MGQAKDSSDGGCFLRIPEEKIKLILDKISLPDLASSYVSLKEKGDDFSGCCPFHNEKTPSFHISGSKNLYHCFGCGKGGSAIQFVMDIENLSFVDALYFLAERTGVKLEEQDKDEEQNALRKKIYDVNKVYAIKCYNDLLVTKEAMDYAISRGLTPEIIKRFCIGYANGELPNEDVDFLKKAGLASEKGKSKFMGRLIFPIIDVRKNVIAFAGRALDKSNSVKYINSPNTLVFNKSYNLFGINIAKSASDKAFLLVEGQMDVISLHKFGFTSAVASCGTAITEGQAKLIKRYKDEVIICYDQDSAGREATKKAIDILKSAHLKVYIASWEDAKDPDEYIQKYGKEAFSKILKNADDSNLYEYKSLAQNYDLTNSNEKIAYMKEVVQLVLQIDSEVEKEIYVNKIAEDTGLSKTSLQAELDRHNKRPNGINTPKSGENIVLQSKDTNEKKLLGILANDFSIAKKHDITKDIFSNELYAGVFSELEAGRDISDILVNDRFAEAQSELAEIFMQDEMLSSDLLIEELLYIIKREKKAKDLLKFAKEDNFEAMQELLTEEKS